MDETPVMMVTQVASSLAQPSRRGQRMTGHNISQPQTHQRRRRRRRRRREPRDQIQCSMMEEVAMRRPQVPMDCIQGPGLKTPSGHAPNHRVTEPRRRERILECVN